MAWNQRRYLRLAIVALCFFSASAALAQFEARSSRRLTHSSCGLSAADFRNGGTQDLAIALNSQSIAVALGLGDGTFQRPVVYQSGNYVNGIATGILTSSGNADIVVADEGARALSLFLGKGDGTFDPPTLIHTITDPGLLTIGDFNNDGTSDILVVAPQAISVLLGNGDGTFTPVNLDLTYRAGSAGVGDFNGDGILDLAVSAQKQENALVILLGNGDGTFRQGASYQFNAPIGGAVSADFNGDGKLDLAVPGVLTGSAYVLLGNGDGTFQSAVSYQASSFVAAVSVGDFNGDGKLDMALVDGNPSGVSLLLGNGDGTFQPPSFFPAASDACYAAVADFNGDGLPDIEIADDGAMPQVVTLLNTGDVAFSPTTPIAFADQFVGTASAPQTVALTNKGATALSISSITASAPYAVTSTCGKSVAPGATCNLNITFSPTTPGTFSGTVLLVDSASTKPQVIEVSGSGTIVTFSPSSLTFGPQKRGTTSPPQRLKMTNTGTTAMTVNKVAVHGYNWTSFDATSDCPSSLAAGANCTITVEFRPLLGNGPQTALVYVNDSGGGSPQTVPLSGTSTN